MPVKIPGLDGCITVKRGETGLPMERVALGSRKGGNGSSSYPSNQSFGLLSKRTTEIFAANRTFDSATVISPRSNLAKIWVTLSFGTGRDGVTADWGASTTGAGSSTTSGRITIIGRGTSTQPFGSVPGSATAGGADCRTKAGVGTENSRTNAPNH